MERALQRHGWDLAAPDYDSLWREQLGDARAKLLACASPAPGERVLDVACGTGLVAFEAAQEVGPYGEVVGIDLSSRMVDAARRRADAWKVAVARFARMDAGDLELPDASFDVALCGFGLMYVPDPARALAEMRRVLRPGGRVAMAVWGERSRCGWSGLFPIVEAEATSEASPSFFALGRRNALARLCADSGFGCIVQRRVAATLDYPDAEAACRAAFVAGPAALAWSRFDGEARARVRQRYVESIAPWRHARGYGIPGDFLIVSARVPRQ